MAGSPPMLGMGSLSGMTSALCGMRSSLTKLITTVLWDGTTSVAAPLLYPSKLNGPLEPGAPASSVKVTTLVAALHHTRCDELCADSAVVQQRPASMKAANRDIRLLRLRPSIWTDTSPGSWPPPHQCSSWPSLDR